MSPGPARRHFALKLRFKIIQRQAPKPDVLYQHTRRRIARTPPLSLRALLCETRSRPTAVTRKSSSVGDPHYLRTRTSVIILKMKIVARNFGFGGECPERLRECCKRRPPWRLFRAAQREAAQWVCGRRAGDAGAFVDSQLCGRRRPASLLGRGKRSPRGHGQGLVSLLDLLLYYYDNGDWTGEGEEADQSVAPSLSRWHFVEENAQDD